MKIISWNVAGIRACIKKGLNDFILQQDADILCFQEVKATQEQFDWIHPQYHVYLNPAEKAGYAGTLVATKRQPIDVVAGFGPDKFNAEGRVITCDMGKFFFITCYTPNSQELLKRLNYRLEWEAELRAFIQKLDSIKPVIYCGDLNVCHKPIDIYDPIRNMYSPGFSKEERGAFDELLSLGFVDTWRELHPEDVGYTYWSYRGNARANNHGWRLDYFVLSKRLLQYVNDCRILTDVQGSDHCPILLDIADRF